MSALTRSAQEPSPRETIFSATLTPHRSLGPRGFVTLMCIIGALSFATGIVFAATGAWPVLGFFGLDVALVYGAFKMNYRAGRLYEHVDLDKTLLKLTRVHPSGKIERFEVPAYWVRVLLDTSPDGRTDLRLTSHGRAVPFGRFLTNDERDSFADALTGALRRTRAAGITDA